MEKKMTNRMNTHHRLISFLGTITTTALVSLIPFAGQAQDSDNQLDCRKNVFGLDEVCLVGPTWDEVESPEICRQDTSRNDRWCTYGFHWSELEPPQDTLDSMANELRNHDPELIGLSQTPAHVLLRETPRARELILEHRDRLENLLRVNRYDDTKWPKALTQSGLGPDITRDALEILDATEPARLRVEQREAERAHEQAVLEAQEIVVNSRVYMENKRSGITQEDYEAALEEDPHAGRDFDDEDLVVDFKNYGGLPCVEGDIGMDCGSDEPESYVDPEIWEGQGEEVAESGEAAGREEALEDGSEMDGRPADDSGDTNLGESLEIGEGDVADDSNGEDSNHEGDIDGGSEDGSPDDGAAPDTGAEYAYEEGETSNGGLEEGSAEEGFEDETEDGAYEDDYGEGYEEGDYQEDYDESGHDDADGYEHILSEDGYEGENGYEDGSYEDGFDGDGIGDGYEETYEADDHRDSPRDGFDETTGGSNEAYDPQGYGTEGEGDPSNMSAEEIRDWASQSEDGIEVNGEDGYFDEVWNEEVAANQANTRGSTDYPSSGGTDAQRFWGDSTGEPDFGDVTGCSQADAERYVARARNSFGLQPTAPGEAANHTLKTMKATRDATRRFHSRCQRSDMANAVQWWDNEIMKFQAWMRSAGIQIRH
jgi:hypothetical protein